MLYSEKVKWKCSDTLKGAKGVLHTSACRTFCRLLCRFAPLFACNFVGKKHIRMARLQSKIAPKSLTPRRKAKRKVHKTPCPDLLFLAFLENGKENPPKKARIFYRCRTPKILGKEGKNAQKSKEFLGKEKSKESTKKARKRRLG